MKEVNGASNAAPNWYCEDQKQNPRLDCNALMLIHVPEREILLIQLAKKGLMLEGFFVGE